MTSLIGAAVDRDSRAFQLAPSDPLRAYAGAELRPASDDLAGFVRRNVRGYFHPVGTCALGSVVDAGRKAETQTQAVAAGKANIVDVVTAVSETEVAVEALVSVRDRVIAAYEEIMKMPI